MATTYVYLFKEDMKKLIEGEKVEVCMTNALRSSDRFFLQVDQKEEKEGDICMKNNDFISFWQEVHTLIDDAMEKRDRTVSVYLHPENGLSVNVYPWPDADELYEMYKDGKITANDFREKMGLPRVELKGKSNKE